MQYCYVAVGTCKAYSRENARILPNIGWCTATEQALIYCGELVVIRYIWDPMLCVP